MTRAFRQFSRLAVLAALACTVTLAVGGTAAASSRSRQAAAGAVMVVSYSSEVALRRAVEQSGSHVVRRIRALHVAVLETRPAATRVLDALRGIRYSERPVVRRELVDPAVAPAPVPGGAYEWQYAAARANPVPVSVLGAAPATAFYWWPPPATAARAEISRAIRPRCCNPLPRAARAALASRSRPRASPERGPRFRTMARTSPWRPRARTSSARSRRALIPAT